MPLSLILDSSHSAVISCGATACRHWAWGFHFSSSALIPLFKEVFAACLLFPNLSTNYVVISVKVSWGGERFLAFSSLARVGILRKRSLEGHTHLFLKLNKMYKILTQKNFWFEGLGPVTWDISTKMLHLEILKQTYIKQYRREKKEKDLPWRHKAVLF